jgi:hypothetical protein
MMLSSSVKNASSQEQVYHSPSRAFPANSPNGRSVPRAAQCSDGHRLRGLHATLSRHRSESPGRQVGRLVLELGPRLATVRDAAHRPLGKGNHRDCRDDLDQPARQRQELAAPAFRAGFRIGDARRFPQCAPSRVSWWIKRFSAIFPRLPGIHQPVRPGSQKGSFP